MVKVTEPASDPQDFDFDLTGVGVPADLDLDTDGGDATLPSQQTFSSNSPARRQHGDRDRDPRLGLTNLDCTGAGADSSTSVARVATLDIDPGENVVCTFTNTKRASLTVVKVTDPASDPQDFDFDLTGADLPTDLDLDTDAGDATLPAADVPLNAALSAPTRSSSPPTAGWTLTNLVCAGAGGDSSTSMGTRTATLDIDAGENVICTFTNTKLAAALTIRKVTDPAEDPQDFDFGLTRAGIPADLDLDTDGGNATLPSQASPSASPRTSSAPTRSPRTVRQAGISRPSPVRARARTARPTSASGPRRSTSTWARTSSARSPTPSTPR